MADPTFLAFTIINEEESSNLKIFENGYFGSWTRTHAKDCCSRWCLDSSSSSPSDCSDAFLEEGAVAFAALHIHYTAQQGQALEQLDSVRKLGEADADTVGKC